MALIVGTLILTGGFGQVRAVTPQPTLVILSPGGLFNPSTVVSSNFQVAFIVTNFQLVQPGLVNQTNQANQGHIITFLDSNFYAIWATANPITYQGVSPGNHTVFVQLVNNDNSPMFPDVSTTFRVTVLAPPPSVNLTSILNAANAAATNSAGAKTSADSANSALATLGTNVQSVSTAVQGVNTAVQSVNTGVQGLNAAIQGVSSALTGINSALTGINSLVKAMSEAQSSEMTDTSSLKSAVTTSVNYSLVAVGLSVVTLLAVIYLVVRKK